MLPFSMGGVVDRRLFVYGTENLRVIDASIMPMISADHLQAVVYAVAKKVRGPHRSNSMHMLTFPGVLYYQRRRVSVKEDRKSFSIHLMEFTTADYD